MTDTEAVDCIYCFVYIFIVYFEVYGCQMNVSDTEVAWSILKNVGYTKTADINEVHFTHTLSQRMSHVITLQYKGRCDSHYDLFHP